MRNIIPGISVDKLVIGMIHCAGKNDDDAVEIAIKEINTYLKGGVDAVLVETYFGSLPRVERVLNYLNDNRIIPYGINCLNVDAMGFELANKYNCAFIQVDSVVGHVVPRDEPSIAAFFEIFRNKTKAKLLGGVRFKYQPMLSKNSLEEDLKIGKTRCDVICVTENKTGQETSLEKIVNFKNLIGDFPLFVCAGITCDNIESKLPYLDGMVIGSYFKDNFKDSGKVDLKHVQDIMKKVNNYRDENNGK